MPWFLKCYRPMSNLTPSICTTRMRKTMMVHHVWLPFRLPLHPPRASLQLGHSKVQRPRMTMMMNRINDCLLNCNTANSLTVPPPPSRPPRALRRVRPLRTPTNHNNSNNPYHRRISCLKLQHQHNLSNHPSRLRQCLWYKRLLP